MVVWWWCKKQGEQQVRTQCVHETQTSESTDDSAMLIVWGVLQMFVAVRERTIQVLHLLLVHHLTAMHHQGRLLCPWRLPHHPG